MGRLSLEGSMRGGVSLTLPWLEQPVDESSFAPFLVLKRLQRIRATFNEPNSVSLQALPQQLPTL